MPQLKKTQKHMPQLNKNSELVTYIGEHIYLSYVLVLLNGFNLYDCWLNKKYFIKLLQAWSIYLGKKG